MDSFLSTTATFHFSYYSLYISQESFLLTLGSSVHTRRQRRRRVDCLSARKRMRNRRNGRSSTSRSLMFYTYIVFVYNAFRGLSSCQIVAALFGKTFLIAIFPFLINDYLQAEAKEIERLMRKKKNESFRLYYTFPQLTNTELMNRTNELLNFDEFSSHFSLHIPNSN